VPPSGQAAAQAGTSATHADSVVLVVLVLELFDVGVVVEDGDGTLLLVDDDVVGEAALVVVVDDVVTAPVPSGAQSSCTALGCTVRLPNWSETVIGATEALGHRTL
jgi:hypothetical protein